MDKEKKGDILDAMLYFGKMGNDPEHFTHYPERVVGTLRILYQTFSIPEGGIPNRKQKSNFDEWINQLDDLNTLAPSQEKMKKAMEMAKSHYDNLNKKFMIIRPASIRGLLLNAVRIINDEEKKAIKEIEENKSKEVVDAEKPLAQSNRFRKLKQGD